MGTRTQRTRHGNKAHGDGIEDSNRDRDEREYGDWAKPGKGDGTGHGNRDKEMGKGKVTGTQGRDKAFEHGTGTQRWDRVQGQSVETETEQGTRTQGLTGLPIATRPSSLLVGAGSGVGILSH